MSFGDLLDRYSIEVSPKKRGARWERIRLQKFCRDPIAKITLLDLSAAHFTDWRERHLATLAPASVAREMQLMNAVLNVAVNEWELIPRDPLPNRCLGSNGLKDRRLGIAKLDSFPLRPNIKTAP